MRVLVFSRFFAPAYLAGGPVQSLSAMVEQAPPSVEVDVVTTNQDLGTADRLDIPGDKWIRRGAANVFYASRSFRFFPCAVAAASTRRPHFVYLNSLFDWDFSIFPQLLGKLGFFPKAQFVVAPRGELNAGALALKPTKKRLFLWLYRVLNLHRHVIWHVSTSHEAADVRRVFGSNVKLITKENETLLGSVATRREDRVAGPCRLIFASRLTEKKRIHLLLEALQLVNLPFELRVVGAFDDSTYEVRCRDLVKQGTSQVEFLGPLQRQEVLHEFARSDVFVFPTAGENFGHVIAEALSVSCPVITSAHTPWTQILNQFGGGVVNDDTPEAYAAAISAFICEGETEWTRRSLSAADAFEEWFAASRTPHLFELLMKG